MSGFSVHVYRDFHDVFKHRHMGKEIEALKDHADAAALLGGYRVGRFFKFPVLAEKMQAMFPKRDAVAPENTGLTGFSAE